MRARSAKGANKRIVFAAVIALFLSLSAQASAPGEPIGCEDVQLNFPGFRVRTYAGPSTDLFHGACIPPVLPTVSLSGLILNGIVGSTPDTCGGTYAYVPSTSYTLFRGNDPQIPFFSVTGRCVDPQLQLIDFIQVDPGGFDWQSGRFLFRIIASSQSPSSSLYEQTCSLCAIERFQRLSDIYQLKRRHGRDSVSDR